MGFPNGWDVRKRDEGGLEVSGVSNWKVGGSVGKHQGSTLARLGLKHLLDKPLGMLGVGWI